MNSLRRVTRWLFVSQEIVRPDAFYDVPRVAYPLWWCMYHTIGRLERCLERVSEK